MDPGPDEPQRPAGRLIGRRAPAPPLEDAPTVNQPRAGSAAPPPDHHVLPATIGPYRVLDEVARGGMGLIVRAHHPRLDRKVAIKLLHAEVSSEPGARARFLLEAQAAARLSRHPGIVQVHDVGTDGERDYLVLDLVDGESLRARIARDGPLEPRLAATLIEKVARAVGHAHHHGVLHRDLKPHNVLIERLTGEPLLTDFGLAKLVRSSTRSGSSARLRVRAPTSTDVSSPHDGNLTLDGDILGTPSYMAPEQIDTARAQVGPATDVWGLGAVLYECLAGAPPFDGVTPLETFQHVLHTPLRAPRGCPQALEAILFRCLEKNPAARYRTADDVARELVRFLDGSPVLGQVVIRRPTGSLSPVRFALALALVAVAVYLGMTRLRPALEALALADGAPSPSSGDVPAIAPPTPTTADLSLPVLPAALGVKPSGLRLSPEPLTRESLSRLAEQGYADAMLIYGYGLLKGDFGPADPARGRTWLERAADAGDPRAAAVLGAFLEKGEAGLPRDHAGARRWLRRGAELGSTECMARLAVVLLQDKVAASDVEALRWLETAHDAGAPNARALLAELLGSDRAAAADLARAVSLWEAEAAAGSARSMFRLGIAFKDGRGTTPDGPRALAWFRRAAEAGSAEAMYALGASYELGLLGLRTSQEQALSWYRRARDAGDADAAERLAALGER